MSTLSTTTLGQMHIATQMDKQPVHRRMVLAHKFRASLVAAREDAP